MALQYLNSLVWFWFNELAWFLVSECSKRNKGKEFYNHRWSDELQSVIK